LAINVATLVARVVADTTGFMAGMTATEGRIASVGASSAVAGRALTKGLTLPIIGVGFAAGKMAFDFNASMSQIRALVGASDQQMKQYERGVLSMAKTLPQGPRELAEALYFVTSSGFKGAAALKVLEASAKASAAGLGQTQEIADAVTSAINAYGPASMTAKRATDVMVAAVREGKMEADALTGVLGNLLPTASALKIPFHDIAGALAAMSRTGASTDEAATQINAFMSSVMSTSPKVVKGLAAMGLTQAELRATLAGPGGLVGAMRQLDDASKGNVEALRNVQPNVRSFRAIMNLLAQDAKVVDSVMNGVKNSVGATDKAFAKASEDGSFKLKQAWSSVQVALIQMGNIIAPIATTVAAAVGGIATAFTMLSPEVQRVILVFLGVAAAVGPLLLIFGALLTPVGAIALAIGGLVAGFMLLYNSSATVRGVIDSLVSAFQIFFSIISGGGGFTTAISAALARLGIDVGALGPKFETAKEAVRNALADIRGIITTVVNVAKAVWSQFGDDIARQAQTAWNTARGVINGALNVIKGIINVFVGVLRGDWSRAWQGVQQIVQGAWGVITSILRGAVGSALNIARAIGSGILSGIKAGLAALAPTMLSLLKAIPTVLQTIAAGVPGIAARIGQAIVSGILSGAGGLLGRLKGFLEGQIKGALSSLNPFSPVEHGGEKYIGRPIAAGALRGGIHGFQPIPGKISEKVKEVVEAARKAVDDQRGKLSDAFGRLADAALGAFDRQMGAYRTEAERALDAMDMEDKINSINQGIADAQKQLAEAMQENDADAIASAQRAVTEAMRAQQRFQLEQQAETERAWADDIIESQRGLLEKKLDALKANITKEGAAHREVHTAVMNILSGFGIDYENAGGAIGTALAKGLRDSKNEVAAAAAELAAEVASRLKTKSPTEKGPMSDLNTWWAGFADTLLSSLDMGAVERGLGVGAPRGAYAGRTAGGGAQNITVLIQPQGHVLTERDLTDIVGRNLREELRRTPGFLDPR
jgi:TP901 family phage tail tape measure protein